MEIFLLTVKQMLLIFILIMVGFILRKKSILPENSGTVMAKMETWIFCPALVLVTQMRKCTVETFSNNATLILYGLVIIVCAIALAYLLSRVFVRNAKTPEELYQRNIYTYALTFGNYGYVGNMIILGVWGEEMFFKFSLFTFFVAIFCSSWGLYVLIPKDQGASLFENLKKGLLTPPIVGLVIGAVLGITGIAKYVPDFVTGALDDAGKCQGPVAMILAGFIIGGYNFKELFANVKVYIVSFVRLICIPAAMMLVLKVLGTDDILMTLALITFATPLGMNTIVYPAAYGGDTKTGASMTMISQVLSVITIPLMYLVFIVMM